MQEEKHFIDTRKGEQELFVSGCFCLFSSLLEALEKHHLMYLPIIADVFEGNLFENPLQICVGPDVRYPPNLLSEEAVSWALFAFGVLFFLLLWFF